VAAVSGIGSQGVTWTTNNGSIDSTGNYTAPGSSGVGTVTACSTQSGDTNVCGKFTITITSIIQPPPVSVSVVCNPATVATNGSSVCVAAVSGISNQSVSWSAGSGSIDGSGNYTAPGSAGTDTVKACSTQSGDTNVCGTATITITSVTPSVSVTCNPATVATNGSSVCVAAVSGVGSQSVSWSAGSGSIDSTGNYTAPGSAGTDTVKACSTQSGDTNICGTFTITIMNGTQAASVSAICNPATVATNGSSVCVAAVSGIGSQGVTWTTNNGSIDGSGNYTAPGSKGSATVKACSSQSGDTNVCGTAAITILGGSGGTYFSCGAGVCALSATPGSLSCGSACSVAPPTVSVTCSPSSILLGATTQCYADLGGVAQTNTTWTIAGSAGGSIDASGVYDPTSGGSETVTGTLPDGTSGNATVTVIVIPACGGAADCQAVCSPLLTANPTIITVPETSNLSYSCTHVTQCKLSGGQFDGGTVEPASDTIQVDPTVTTPYTLNCVNSVYSDSSASSSATVTVNGSNRCEQNPNGAGCAGQ
jgi:hypothetical protein